MAIFNCYVSLPEGSLLDCHFSLLRLFACYACYTACFLGGGSCKQCRSLMSERKSVRKRGASTALPGMSWHCHCHQWAPRGYWMLGFEAIASQPVNISHSIWNDDIYIYILYIIYIYIIYNYMYIYILYPKGLKKSSSQRQTQLATSRRIGFRLGQYCYVKTHAPVKRTWNQCNLRMNRSLFVASSPHVGEYRIPNMCAYHQQNY